jgi:hypothetical protein
METVVLGNNIAGLFINILRKCKVFSILFKPANLGFIPWHKPAQLAPEGPGMIFDPGVDQFVQNYIVHDAKGCHDQPPGKAQSSSDTARTPTRSGRRNPDFFISEQMLCCKIFNPFRNNDACLGFVPIYEYLPGSRKVRT